MTKSTKLETPPYILELSFDVNQITQSLHYRFISPEGKKCEQVDMGPLAGTFRFKRGDEIMVRVNAKVETKDKKTKNTSLDLNITNCTIVSIEAPNGKDLSLFDPYNACTVISEWSLPKTKTDTKTHVKTITTTALRSLVVSATEGQWKLSGYLSVLIGQDENQKANLYYFDPESSADGGEGLEHG